MNPHMTRLIVTLMTPWMIVACDEQKKPAVASSPWPGFTTTQVTHIRQMAASSSPLAVDETNEVSHSQEAAELGHLLFFDTGLSSTASISCATCHQHDHGFSLSASVGMGQAATPRHPPSLLNVAYQRWFDWDGKADSLWSQAARPLESPAEHATTRTAIARHILLTPALRARYLAIFPTPELPDEEIARAWPAQALTGEDASPAQRLQWEAISISDRDTITLIFTRVLKAIAAYEARLVRMDSRFDRWVAWQDTPQASRTGSAPMSEAEVRGLQHFTTTGRCTTCHTGPLLSDMDFHNLGLGTRDWLVQTPPDQGRAQGARTVKRSALNALGDYSAMTDGERARWTKFLIATPENLGQFKTPTLRNVELSPPYMHGGHFETLDDVVRFYVNLDEDVQTGHREESLRPASLTTKEQLELVAFLKALTGAPPEEERARWFMPPR